MSIFSVTTQNTKELINLYSKADVFVAPSIWDEPLGLVILEAMACETPVVVTRKGGIPLAVKEGKNGLFIRAKRVGDIIQKVNYLLNDEKKEVKDGKKKQEKWPLKKFDWEIIAKKFFTIYQKFGRL